MVKLKWKNDQISGLTDEFSSVVCKQQAVQINIYGLFCNVI